MNKTAKSKRAIRMYSNPVSISLFNKGKANEIFEEVNAEGAKAVLKNNKRIAVIVSPADYDEMMEKLEDYELLFETAKRMKAGNKKSIVMKDAMEMFGVTQEDLDNTDVNIDI